MRPRFGPRKPHPVPGVRPDTSNPTAPFCGSEGPACGLPSTSEALCHRPLAGRQRSRMGCRYRHSLWGCLLRRLRHEPVSPLTLTALSLGPFSGWRPARESLTAMEPKPPVPVSSTKRDYKRTKSESQAVSRQSPQGTLALARTESSPICRGAGAPRFGAGLWQRTVLNQLRNSCRNA